MLDYQDTGRSICLIMEYVSGGELREYVEEEGPLTEEDAREFFGPICKAVRFCHNKNYVHRDLKLDNILLNAEKVPKIVDFGLSGLLTSAEGNVTDAGTLAYIAPEVRQFFVLNYFVKLYLLFHVFDFQMLREHDLDHRVEQCLFYSIVPLAPVLFIFSFVYSIISN